MDEAMHKAIQVRAYFLWLEAGRPDGQDVLHWLQAEAEAELGVQSGSRRERVDPDVSQRSASDAG